MNIIHREDKSARRGHNLDIAYLAGADQIGRVYEQTPSPQHPRPRA
jgi:hypothetical protein